MVKREKQIFAINLKVKGNNQEVKELRGKVSLEISWQGNKGILNPGEPKNFTDKYGTHSYRESKGEVIELEKDGKKHKILVKINEIKKGLFKDKITELGEISPVSGSDFIIVEDNRKRREESGRRLINEEDPSWKIKPTKRRWGGYILVGGVIVFFLLVIIIVFCYYSERRK